MLTLLLMRHAKSDWESTFADDHGRPLARRGEKAARRMGQWLTACELVPEHVLSSSAERAFATAERAARAGGWTCPIEPTRSLYEASAEQVLRVIRGLGAQPGVLLLVGHEPTCSELLGLLTGGGRCRFPTSAVAVIEVAAGSWAELAPGRGQLLALVPPRWLMR